MGRSVQVEILRNGRGGPPGDAWSWYEVPHFDRMDVSDVLKHIRDEIDPTLAFRYSCEEGKCGLCGVEVNGRSVLACKRIVAPGESLSLRPLPGLPVLKDLLVDRSGFDDQLAVHRSAVGGGRSDGSRDEEGLAAYIELSNCVECGVCTSACPARSAGVHGEIGPVGFLESVRVSLFEGGGPEPCGVGGDLFDCLECGQCEELCSRDVPVPSLVARARGAIRTRGGWPSGPREVIARLEEGEPLLARPGRAGTGDWLRKASDAVRACAGTPQAEVGVFVGCQFGLRSSLQHVPQRLIELLLAAGVDVAVLGDEERCCGHPCDGAGSPQGVRASARYHIDAFRRRSVETLVVGCPGCYRAWSVEYPRELGEPIGIEVVHVSVYLARLIAEGRLELAHPYGRSLVYHDPCELGRLSGVFDEPRALLDRVPASDRRRVERERGMGMCCGGGGLVPSTGGRVATDVSALRIEQLLATGAETIVTACPNCEFTLTSGMRAAGRNRPGGVVDLVEVIHASVFGADRQGRAKEYSERPQVARNGAECEGGAIGSRAEGEGGAGRGVESRVGACVRSLVGGGGRRRRDQRAARRRAGGDPPPAGGRDGE